jgi:casein kinase I homolog HRR25
MLSNYDIEPYISNGTFSTLYKGIHKIKKHKVVIKTHYDSTSKRLLENEIKLYAYLLKCKYKHIPFIKFMGEMNDIKYIIMDYKSDQFLNVTIDIIDKVKDSLNELHSLKIIHRDIKPENFLMENNKVFIIDFGLSTFYTEHVSYGLIGNTKYCSYKCHTKNYIYDYKDDMISMIYMFLDLYNGFVPWKYDFTKKCDFRSYYKSDTINEYLFKLFELYLSLS